LTSTNFPKSVFNGLLQGVLEGLQVIQLEKASKVQNYRYQTLRNTLNNFSKSSLKRLEERVENNFKRVQ